MENRTRVVLPPVLIWLVCVGFLGSLLAGCGSDSTINPVLSLSDNLSRDPAAATPEPGTGGKGEPQDEMEIPTDDPHLGPGSLTAEFDVDPELGGTFAAGRVVLSIPPRALTEPITLKISDSSYGSMTIIGELLPHGQVFLKPVTLGFDLRGTVAEDWENGGWVDIGGTHDLDSHILSVELEHFSTYGVGRAGWFHKPPPPLVQEPAGDRPEAGTP